MYDYADYLEGTYAKPTGPRRLAHRTDLTTRPAKPRKDKPARFCGCGQKLSIANEGIACFICTRKKSKDLS